MIVAWLIVVLFELALLGATYFSASIQDDGSRDFLNPQIGILGTAILMQITITTLKLMGGRWQVGWAVILMFALFLLDAAGLVRAGGAANTVAAHRASRAHELQARVETVQREIDRLIALGARSRAEIERDIEQAKLRISDQQAVRRTHGCTAFEAATGRQSADFVACEPVRRLAADLPLAEELAAARQELRDARTASRAAPVVVALGGMAYSTLCGLLSVQLGLYFALTNLSRARRSVSLPEPAAPVPADEMALRLRLEAVLRSRGGTWVPYGWVEVATELSVHRERATRFLKALEAAGEISIERRRQGQISGARISSK